MNQDKENFNSEDLQRTMEVPVAGGKKESAGGIFDPWHLNAGGPSDSILDSIAKSLQESNKMPETITVSAQDDEKKQEPDKAKLSAENMKEISGEIIPETEKEKIPDPEPENNADATMVIPAISGLDKNTDKDSGKTIVLPVTPMKNEQENEIVREKNSGGRLWPPVLMSSIFIIIACFITLTVGLMPVMLEHGFARGMTQIMSPVINAGEPPAYTNILLVGVDEDGYRTDTMMVATYDNENKRVAVMQLPRDTYVHNNGRRDKKLNSAYYSGIDQLKEEVKIAYGIETHKYVEVNLEAFRKLIDAIGGVETVVPFNMVYDDPTQDFHIYLLAKKDANGTPLPQLLDGKKAEQFVRFRKNNDGSGYPMGDLQRMEAQKQFIMDTVKQMISIDGLKNIDELIKIAQENLKTDLTFEEIYSYCTAVLTLEDGKIEFITAPGEAADLPGGSYFVVDYDGARDVAQNYFYATQATMAKMKKIVVQPVLPEETETEDPDDTDVSQTPTGQGGSSAVTRPDENDEPEPEVPEEDSGSGAMSR